MVRIRALMRRCREKRVEVAAMAVVAIALATAFMGLYRGMASNMAMTTPAPAAAVASNDDADADDARSFAAGYAAGSEEGRRMALGQAQPLTNGQIDREVRRRSARFQATSSDAQWLDGWREGARLGLRHALGERFPPQRVAGPEHFMPQRYTIEAGSIEAVEMPDAKQAVKNDGTMAANDTPGAQQRVAVDPRANFAANPNAENNNPAAQAVGSGPPPASMPAPPPSNPVRQYVDKSGTTNYTNL